MSNTNGIKRYFWLPIGWYIVRSSDSFGLIKSAVDFASALKRNSTASVGLLYHSSQRVVANYWSVIQSNEEPMR